ncbi:histidine kinase [Streptomyces sp. NPDC002896]|uniref:sensor histidine kinase n=1 Tax=Streptomyces sp. NPDC002896 TaxID=3154438 RepID=UPI003331DAAF
MAASQPGTEQAPHAPTPPPGMPGSRRCLLWGVLVLLAPPPRSQHLVEQLQATRDILAQQQRQAGMLAERARIARHLHDSLARELAGSRMLLQLADRDCKERRDVARIRVRAVADGLDAGLVETRRIMQDLAPSAVAEAGLEGSLHLLCARAQADGTAARLEFRSVGAHQPLLEAQGAATLFRVAQSTLANVREYVYNACAPARTDRGSGMPAAPRAPARIRRGLATSASMGEPTLRMARSSRSTAYKGVRLTPQPSLPPSARRSCRELAVR